MSRVTTSGRTPAATAASIREGTCATTSPVVAKFAVVTVVPGSAVRKREAKEFTEELVPVDQLLRGQSAKEPQVP
nr:hypothetical protein [Rathayibacter sp. AY1B8]